MSDCQNTWSLFLYRALIRVSLVVTETVDAGLLGEHTIPTLRHAWRELLEPANQASAGGHVIPCGARVYATAIECVETRQQSRYVNHAALRTHNSSEVQSCTCVCDDLYHMRESDVCALITPHWKVL